MEWTYHQHYGSPKPYVAQITGTDAQYGFARHFLRGEGQRSRSGKTSDLTFTVQEIGLYEIRGEKGQKEFRLVWDKPEKGIVWTVCAADRAHRLAQLLDDAVDIETARQQTRQGA